MRSVTSWAGEGARTTLGLDRAFWLKPGEFNTMVDAVRIPKKALGDVRYRVGEQEPKARVLRRSLFVVRDMKAGELFTAETVHSIRSATGYTRAISIRYSIAVPPAISVVAHH